MKRPVLVINCGSSSLKFRLYDMALELPLLSGTLERIGEGGGGARYHLHENAGGPKAWQDPVAVSDHAEGLERVFESLQGQAGLESMQALDAIGHRVVHGGEVFSGPLRIDEDVVEAIRNTIPLAPLHNPANLMGIEAARRRCPGVPQVAVFDTAFFHTLPPRAYRYALPEELYRDHGLRRYGFHGTSHQYVASQAAKYLDRPLNSLRLISLHLGNGASMAAIRDGICIDTSMGMTPLEGLIMGTRCGDLDPSIPCYLARELGMGLAEVETLLNYESGMKGLCGAKDMREVRRLADDGVEEARLALDMYRYRICKYIGAYYAALGGLDALVFTGGVGENDTSLRREICRSLSVLGVVLSAGEKAAGEDGILHISSDSSPVTVLVVPANEELEIARQTVAVINETG